MTAFSTLAPKDSPTRWTSLRARLIASHLAVLLLALSLILVISAISLRVYARQVEIDRLRDLAVPLVAEAQLLLAPGRDRFAREAVAEVLGNQAEAMKIRLLVLDREGLVRFDSASGAPAEVGSNLEGRRLIAFTAAVDEVLARAAVSGLGRVVARPEEGENPFGDARVILAASGRRVAAPAVVALVTPVTEAPVRGRLLPPLLLILAASLAIASAAGYLLSRRIAAPIERVTAATDAMAGGALEQSVPGEGSDEIGRLVTSFNTMSRRVAATARAQRDLLANV
ncbi:MAG: HAMP domain-containing protein, partial [Chloroflexota bacterium]|nr:HAMP domain-containing protein [Chloroflexota bacterium]